MDESRFSLLANQTLEHLADAIDDALGDRIDVDLDHGILTLTLDDHAQYVINKHGPMRQIWLSSPFSGAGHYQYRDDEGWFCSRDPQRNLQKTILTELTAKYHVTIEL